MPDPIVVLLPLLIPVLGAVTHLLARSGRPVPWVVTCTAAGILASGIELARRVMVDGPVSAAGGQLRVDALSAFMLVVIGAVSLIAALATPAYLRAESAAGATSRRVVHQHSVLVQAFLAAMVLAVAAAGLGGVWVAIEATTIVTAFLVGQRRNRAALEAAWKYVVICSVGIALAFLGTVLLNYASTHGAPGAGLDLAALAARGAELDPGVTRIAVALLVLGFGTKAGLAPLHAWLPDAHSQAPAPVSALMSGVLLSVAFYAVLRVKLIADAALGTGFARALLLTLALATLVLAASLLLAQRDYKRMLAYSSIEHMGLIALGAAAGSRAAAAGILLHMLGHGLAKSVLFLGSGRILHTTGTSLVSGVRGLTGHQPWLAGTFGIGVLALLGMPPFSLFASELAIARAGFADGIGWATAVAFVLVLVIAAALLSRTGAMLLGPPPAVHAGQQAGTATGTIVPLVAGLVVCAALGTTLGPLHDLLHAASQIVGTP
jgi:hydrogenase-4 component F